MIHLHVHEDKMELEMRGSDATILDELSTAVVRILDALERSDGNPANENMTFLILMLLNKMQE